MKTTLNMVLSVLEKCKPIIRFSCEESSTIDAVDFIDINQKRFEPNILYLGRTSDFVMLSKTNSPVNIMLVEDRPLEPDRIDNDELNLVILDNSNDLYLLHKEIYDFLKCQQDFNQKLLALYECFVSGRGLQALVDKGMELFDNPLAVFDINLNVLTYAHKGLIDEPLWNEVILKGFIPYDTAIQIKKSRVMEKAFNGKAPSILNVPYMKNRLLSWRIVLSGETVGHIALLENSSRFKKNDMELLRLLCDLVSIELQKNIKSLHTKGSPFEHLISDLLNGKLRSKELLKERLTHLGLKLKENFHILTAEFCSDLKSNIPLAYVRDILEQIISGSKCAVWENKIIMLIYRSKRTPFSDDEMNYLDSFLKENQMLAGVSRSFTDIINIKGFYIQACKAIEYGRRLDTKKSVYFYDDFSEFHLLDMAAVSGDIKAICSPLIPRLLEYDRINNCDLVKSLCIYLSSGNNLTRTAKKIGIHRNSMDYRIKKIEEVLDINLDDPSVTFSLNLSMKIMQFVDGEDFFECGKNTNRAIS